LTGHKRFAALPAAEFCQLLPRFSLRGQRFDADIADCFQLSLNIYAIG
jgi:hypothetical protein